VSDASTAGAGAATAGAAGAPDAQQQTGQQAAEADFLEIEHEIEPGKPTKLKIPKSKLSPELAKFRAELDRRASKFDLDNKAFQERTTKLESILQAAKSSPEAAEELLKSIGVDVEGFSEAQIAKKVKALMRAEEEKADPSKKASREQQERLEKLEADARKREDDDKANARKQQVERTGAFVESIAQKFPDAYRQDARMDVIAVLRAQLAAGKDPQEIKADDLFTAARKLAIARGKRAAGLEAEPQGAKVIQHPASAPRKAPAGGAAKPKETPGAGDYLMGLLQGFPKRR
jgi:hypothetical protein